MMEKCIGMETLYRIAGFQCHLKLLNGLQQGRLLVNVRGQGNERTNN
jgi:hypothetical protein